MSEVQIDVKRLAQAGVAAVDAGDAYMAAAVLASWNVMTGDSPLEMLAVGMTDDEILMRLCAQLEGVIDGTTTVVLKR